MAFSKMGLVLPEKENTSRVKSEDLSKEKEEGPNKPSVFIPHDPHKGRK
jgi:hypothetical protein